MLGLCYRENDEIAVPWREFVIKRLWRPFIIVWLLVTSIIIQTRYDRSAIGRRLG